MADSFPLDWPADWKRTPAHNREKPAYRISDSRAVDELTHELKLFGAHGIVVSSNIAVKRDGSMYANQAASVDDPGVAVYYSTRQFSDRVIACDKWERVYHNVYAIAKTIAAMRAIQRAGASQILDRAFTAFGALPSAAAAPKVRPWWEVLGLQEAAIKGGFVDLIMIEAKYRELARAAHPDRNGGHDTALVEINGAIEQARRHFGK